jgi:hypothetical protein
MRDGQGKDPTDIVQCSPFPDIRRRRTRFPRWTAVFGITQKNETGRVGPVSEAPVEMRLHPSVARLVSEINAEAFASAFASRASEKVRRSEDTDMACACK